MTPPRSMCTPAHVTDASAGPSPRGSWIPKNSSLWKRTPRAHIEAAAAVSAAATRRTSTTSSVSGGPHGRDSPLAARNSLSSFAGRKTDSTRTTSSPGVDSDLDKDLASEGVSFGDHDRSPRSVSPFSVVNADFSGVLSPLRSCCPLPSRCCVEEVMHPLDLVSS